MAASFLFTSRAPQVASPLDPTLAPQLSLSWAPGLGAGVWPGACPLPTPLAQPAARVRTLRRPVRSHRSLGLDWGGVPLAGGLIVVLVLLALVVVPERPWDQEAICQRHAGVEACRVW